MKLKFFPAIQRRPPNKRKPRVSTAGVFAPLPGCPVSSRMEKNRLEAFSDGVLAIIITIMVLELKVPRGSDLAALKPLLPVFLTYVLSFIYRRDLLEQPSSSAEGRAQSERRP